MDGVDGHHDGAPRGVVAVGASGGGVEALTIVGDRLASTPTVDGEHGES
ncbi:hypothetical protein [Mycolicibacterium litorale]|nr:hypothetical protein [Mycolicibacterium litorale]MCV7418443.1 hypothetical protein [Mycolicibacterium litorale]